MKENSGPLVCGVFSRPKLRVCAEIENGARRPGCGEVSMQLGSTRARPRITLGTPNPGGAHLLNGAGEPIEDEAILALGAGDGVADDADDNLVRHKPVAPGEESPSEWSWLYTLAQEFYALSECA